MNEYLHNICYQECAYLKNTLCEYGLIKITPRVGSQCPYNQGRTINKANQSAQKQSRLEHATTITAINKNPEKS